MEQSDVIEQHFQDSLRFFDSQLFADVQHSAIFVDSKTFADAVPKVPLVDILQQYEAKDSETFDLKGFISQHFTLPQDTELSASQRGTTVSEHIDHLWTLLQKDQDEITAGSLLPLKHAYIVPGGRFREIYYWDSYFTALGLMASGRVGVVEAMWHNFIDLQARFGCIPNGNRSYYHSRSQPPVLALLGELLMPHYQHDLAFVSKCITGLEAEYRFWMSGEEQLSATKPAHKRTVLMPDGSVLNRYWDDKTTPRPESYREDIELSRSVPESQRPAFYRNIRAACESGWDFSSRWLADDNRLHSIRTTGILPIDLNCLLCQLEIQLAKYYSLLAQQGKKQGKKQDKSSHYQEKAAVRVAAINKYMWSARMGYFFDYDLAAQAISPVKSLAGVLPLFIQIATPAQAAQVADIIESEFLREGGLITTVQTSLQPSPQKSGQQWDAPNGWAPLHWFTVQGLIHYQHKSQHQPLADTIMRRWVNTVATFFAHSGKIMEKYDVCQPVNQATGGEYDVQEGFGWTNGVTQVLYQWLGTVDE